MVAPRRSRDRFSEIAPPARRIENPSLVPITSILGIEIKSESTSKPALARMPRAAPFEPPHILLPGECPGPAEAGCLRDEADSGRRADECRLADRRALRNVGDRRRWSPAAETGRVSAPAIAAPGSHGAPHGGLWRARRSFPGQSPSARSPCRSDGPDRGIERTSRGRRVRSQENIRGVSRGVVVHPINSPWGTPCSSILGSASTLVGTCISKSGDFRMYFNHLNVFKRISANVRTPRVCMR